MNRLSLTFLFLSGFAMVVALIFRSCDISTIAWALAIVPLSFELYLK